LIALFLTLNPGRGEVVIDYLGTALIAAAATCLVLMTTLGGNTYPWTSWPIIAFGLAGAALLVAWVLAERRAVDPVLPLALFKNRVFSLTAAVAFIVGLAMLGCITFLPLFMQIVHGVSPTASGLQLTPIMLGLLTMSIISGQLISRTGRYKVFPIAGTLITSIGLFLLSRMDENTPRWETVVYMAVLGVGLGLVMQVLTIIVQNAVEPRDLGVATSSAQFFRSMGASLGVALFGAIFTNQLAVNVAGLSGAGGSAAFSNMAALRQLPAALQMQLLYAFASALDTVFLAAVPVALLGFALAWFVPEVPLRRRQPAQLQEVAAA